MIYCDRTTLRSIWATNTPGSGGDGLKFQTDGNLVIYNNDGGVAWSSNTVGKAGTKLVLQDDGNLVLYGDDGSAHWGSNTVGECEGNV